LALAKEDCDRYIAVRAPASIANLGPGFDILAASIAGLYDVVEICVKRGQGSLSVVAEGFGVPSGRGNAAYAVAKWFIDRLGLDSVSIDIKIHKGVPPSAGLGSSGATSAATAVALAELFKPDVPSEELVKIAGLGEEHVAGAAHYDNVAASILGGFVLIDLYKMKFHRVEPKRRVDIVVVTPSTVQPSYRKTEYARAVLPKTLDLRTCVIQSSLVAKLVLALVTGDLELLGEAVSADLIVEPYRSKLIPYYSELKKLAFENGALGFNISGAGPSVFAVVRDEASAKRLGETLVEFLKARNVDARFFTTYISSRGAEVLARYEG